MSLNKKHGGLRFLKVIVTSAELEALDLIGKAMGFRNREQTIKHLIKQGYHFVSNELSRIQQEQAALKETKLNEQREGIQKTSSEQETETGQISKGEV